MCPLPAQTPSQMSHTLGKDKLLQHQAKDHPSCASHLCVVVWVEESWRWIYADTLFVTETKDLQLHQSTSFFESKWRKKGERSNSTLITKRFIFSLCDGPCGAQTINPGTDTIMTYPRGYTELSYRLRNSFLKVSVPLILLGKLIRVTSCLNSDSRNVKLTPSPKLSSKNENSVIVFSLKFCSHWNISGANSRTAEFSKTTEVYGDLFQYKNNHKNHKNGSVYLFRCSSNLETTNRF